ncbi:hypothetical protein PR202_gb00812 [Eleusine coracana subsp. coracana]|uniref:Uncharacterized protein n=1 Tax=Eleusine coracana subsp. coracana TaxID=191504 RepID=A0AAV5DV87_ELECO|nr:hypothetical protein PR202_gb00812 [Eleusine coracana subsp. coracana]
MASEGAAPLGAAPLDAAPPGGTTSLMSRLPTVEDTSPDTTPHGLSFSSSNAAVVVGASDAASASSFFDPMHFCYDAAPSLSFPIARSSKELGGGKRKPPNPNRQQQLSPG